MQCDWDWNNSPVVCVDFRADTRQYNIIPMNPVGFEQIRGRHCLVRLPHGRQFRGWPRELEPTVGVFFELEGKDADGDEKYLVLETGAPVEIYPLE